MEVKFKRRLDRGKPGSGSILNRIVTVTGQGLEYAADQSRADILMKGMCIDESRKRSSDAKSGKDRLREAMSRRRSSTAWRREFIQSGGGKRHLPGPGSHGHAVRGARGVKVHSNPEEQL